MEMKFKREIDSLAGIFELVSDFMIANEIDTAHKYTLEFVLEELFTNLVKYNRESSADILISLERVGDELILKVVDDQVHPFDVTKTGKVDIHQPLAEREVGGLGLHLVKNMVDKLEYKHANRQSTITVIMKLES